MGNCSLKAVSETNGPNSIRILTDSGSILEFSAPKLAHEVLNFYPGNGIFRRGHGAAPMGGEERLLRGRFYYLLPLTAGVESFTDKRVAIREGKFSKIRVASGDENFAGKPVVSGDECVVGKQVAVGDKSLAGKQAATRDGVFDGKLAAVGDDCFAGKQLATRDGVFDGKLAAVGDDCFAGKQLAFGDENFARNQVRDGNNNFSEKHEAIGEGNFAEKQVVVGNENFSETRVAVVDENLAEKLVAVGDESFLGKEVTGEDLGEESAVEVLPCGGDGFWRVRLVISTRELEEILSGQHGTETLIERMRAAAGATPTHAKARWRSSLSRGWRRLSNTT